MKRVVSFGYLLLVPWHIFGAAPSVQWVRPHPDLAPYNLQSVRQLIDPEGNLYVATRTSQSDSDMSLAKFDPAGNRLWVRHFDNGANGYDEPVGMGLDAAGNIYMAGYSGFPRDFAVVKYSSAGDLLWSRGYAGPDDSDDIAAAAAVDPFGNVHVVGSGQVPYTFGRLEGALRVSWNANGDLVSVSQSSPYSFANSVAVDSQGRVATGVLYPWASTVSINGQSYTGWSPIALHIDGDDNLLAAFTSGDLALIKFDHSGNELWRSDAPLGDSSEYTLRSDRKGTVIVMESHNQDDGAFTRLSKFSSDGVPAWSTTLSDAFTSLQALAITRRGDILLAPINVRQAGWPTTLVALDPRGRTRWNIPAASNQVVAALSADDNGNFYTSGHGLVVRYSTHK